MAGQGSSAVDEKSKLHCHNIQPQILVVSSDSFSFIQIKGKKMGSYSMEGWMNGRMDRQVIKQISPIVNCEIEVVGMWLFVVQFSQLFCVCQHFHIKRLERKVYFLLMLQVQERLPRILLHIFSC